MTLMISFTLYFFSKILLFLLSTIVSEEKKECKCILFLVLGVCLITVNMVVNAHSPGTVSTVTVPILVTRELLVTIVSLKCFLLLLIEFLHHRTKQNKKKTKVKNI